MCKKKLRAREIAQYSVILRFCLLLLFRLVFVGHGAVGSEIHRSQNYLTSQTHLAQNNNNNNKTA